MTSLQKVENMIIDIHDLPNHLLDFTMCLRSLYADNDALLSGQEGTPVHEMLDKTRKDALIYVKKIMPFSVEVMRYVQKFLGYYAQLSFSSWKTKRPYILKEVNAYDQCCSEIQHMHNRILISIKQNHDNAKISYDRIKLENKNRYAEKESLKQSSARKTRIARALLIVPIVNIIASPIMYSVAAADMKSAMAMETKHTKSASVIDVLGKHLIPALKEYERCIGSVAGFFSVLHVDLISFQDIDCDSDEDDDELRFHHEMLQEKATEIKIECERFYSILPSVQTDLMCIKEQPDDAAYIQRWVDEQSEHIKKRNSGITRQLKRVLIQLAIEAPCE